MSHQLICTWLGLPADGWPPDHYRLLGLSPGEPDAVTIEQRVHERLETVRRYQLTHPEPATEVMNRLAQAFVCLTDPETKKAYDATLLRRPASGSARGNVQPSVLSAEPMAPPKLDLMVALTPIQAEIDTQVEATIAILPPPAPVPPEKVDPVVEAARSSAPARRGLGTKRALYHRIARTRQLLRAWEATGPYVGDPEKRVSHPAEAIELIEQLTTIRTMLRSFPPLLGEAGQPGYLVIALARLHVIVPTFQTLLPSQRQALARDWESGQKLLREHRDFIRLELRAMRKRSLLGRAYRAVKTLLTDQPGMVLFLLALLALNVALWKGYLSKAWLGLSGQRPPASSDR